MIRRTDRYFPEFQEVFPSFGKMALAVLDCTPFPNEIENQEPSELLETYRTVEGMKSPQLPKTKKLNENARTSIGLTEGQQLMEFIQATVV